MVLAATLSGCAPPIGSSALAVLDVEADTEFGGAVGRAVAWGDVDCDGDLDVAVANYYDTANEVFENDGGTLLAANPLWTQAEAHASESVAWGDVDDDDSTDDDDSAVDDDDDADDDDSATDAPTVAPPGLLVDCSGCSSGGGPTRAPLVGLLLLLLCRRRRSPRRRLAWLCGLCLVAPGLAVANEAPVEKAQVLNELVERDLAASPGGESWGPNSSLDAVQARWPAIKARIPK